MKFLRNAIRNVGKAFRDFTKCIFGTNRKEKELMIHKLQEENSVILHQLSSALARIEKIEEACKSISDIQKCLQEIKHYKPLPQPLQEQEMLRPFISNINQKEQSRDWSYTSVEEYSDRNGSITWKKQEDESNEVCGAKDKAVCTTDNVEVKEERTKERKGFGDFFSSLIQGWKEKIKN